MKSTVLILTNLLVDIPIDHSLGNALKKPSPLGQPPLVPVFNNNVAQPSQSKTSATGPNGTDNREMGSIPTPAAPIAQHHQGQQVPKSRPRSFKNRLGGPSKKLMPPPFPDVHMNNGKLNERQVDNPREKDRLSVPASAENIRRLQSNSMAASKGNTQQQNIHRGHNVSAVELNAQQHKNDCSTENIPSELGPESHTSEVESPPIPNLKEQSRHVLEDISNIGTRNVYSNVQCSRHDPSETHTPQSVPQRVPSRSRPVTPSSHPRSRTGQPRAESSHPVNRPVAEQALAPQGVSKQHHTNGSKVSKTYTGQARDKHEALGSITLDILEKMKVYERSVGSLGHLSAELEERREIIEAQLNDNIKLNESLREVKSELQNACWEKEILEREQKDLSGELDKLQRTCKRYREHMNDVIKCQKALEADSVGLQKKINTLHQEANGGIAAQRANVEAKITELNALLAEIKKNRGEETESKSSPNR
jgi:predicted  nucleic acid-binding Zn-ribbon protein